MAIELTDQLYPYTVHVSSGHYFIVYAPFEFINELMEEIDAKKSKKAGRLEFVCLNNQKKAFFRQVYASVVLSADDDHDRKPISLEEMKMDAKEIRTRNARKKAAKSANKAKTKLSQKAEKRSL